MSLLTIAEILSGETLVSPGGPVDRLTAAADDVSLWHWDAPSGSAGTTEHAPAVLQEELALA